MFRINRRTLQDETNAVAHLDNLKAELTEVTRQLSLTHESNNNLVDENERIKGENSYILSEIDKKMTESNLNLDMSKKKLSEANVREDESISFVATNVERFNKIEGEHVARVTAKVTELKNHESYLDGLKTTIEEHKNIHTTILSDIESERKTLDSVRQQIQDGHIELEQLNISRSNINKDIDRANIELNSIGDEITNGKILIESPRKFIEEENQKLDVKRKDLHIIESRLKSWWNKVNPDRAMPI